MKSIFVGLSVLVLLGSAWAKLPAPTDEAKAKAAEAAAKTAHAGKVDAYQLCKAQDNVVAHQNKASKARDKAKDAKAAPSACADPGPFVYAPAAVAAAPAPAVADKSKKP